MQVDKELLPAIQAIVIDAEDKLSKLVGTPVRMKMELLPDEINEAFLQELVCNAFDVTWNDIIGRSREQTIADARHVYWWLSVKYLEKKPYELKRETKRKDHSTIVHGRDRIQGLVDHGTDRLCKTITKIEAEISNVIHHSTT